MYSQLHFCSDFDGDMHVSHLNLLHLVQNIRLLSLCVPGYDYVFRYSVLPHFCLRHLLLQLMRVASRLLLPLSILSEMLITLLEETLAKFLSKATGTAVDWVQMPGMKPGSGSVGIFTISQSCSGVAARAFGLVSLHNCQFQSFSQVCTKNMLGLYLKSFQPLKIAEILRDRPTLFRDCRSLEVFTMLPAGNGGTIELLYSLE